MFVESPYMLNSEITFYLGKRFASQNSLRFGSSRISYYLTSLPIDRFFQLHHNLSLLEYSGSLRYNLMAGSFMIFVKGGYDLSWHRIGKVSINSESFSDPNGTSVSPRIWTRPLSPLYGWHFGGGIEWIPGSSPSGIDIGIRGEALIYRRSIGISIDVSSLIPQEFPNHNALVSSQLTTRHMFNLAVVITF